MNTLSLNPKLLDRIYEAAVIPERWSDVLADVATLTEAALASLFAFDGTVLRWIGTPAAMSLIDDNKAVETTIPNTRIPRWLERSRSGFAGDLDVFTPQEIEEQPFYTEFLRPRGYGWVVANLIKVPTGETLFISAERNFARGPVEQRFVNLLDNLAPHFARSALLSTRLGLERAKAMTHALRLVGLPAAVLRTGGRLVAANEQLEALIPTILHDRRDRISVNDPAADALLGIALARRNEQPWPVQSIPIAASDDRPPMIIHLIPVAGNAQDIFVNSTVILLVTPVVRQKVPTATVLQGLFDLTPAEANVARGVGEALSVGEIAILQGLTRDTIRSHLKSVLAKTGLHRQAQLAHLLAGVPRGETTG